MESTTAITPKSIIKNYLLASELIDLITYEDFKNLFTIPTSIGSKSDIDITLKQYYLHYVQLKNQKRKRVDKNIETEFLLSNNLDLNALNESIEDENKLPIEKLNEVLNQLINIEKYLDKEMRAAQLEYKEVLGKFSNIEAELSQIHLSQPKEYESDLLINKWI